MTFRVKRAPNGLIQIQATEPVTFDLGDVAVLNPEIPKFYGPNPDLFEILADINPARANGTEHPPKKLLPRPVGSAWLAFCIIAVNAKATSSDYLPVGELKRAFNKMCDVHPGAWKRMPARTLATAYLARFFEEGELEKRRIRTEHCPVDSSLVVKLTPRGESKWREWWGNGVFHLYPRKDDVHVRYTTRENFATALAAAAGPIRTVGPGILVPLTEDKA